MTPQIAPRRIALFFYNMGGPATGSEVEPFLRALFSDNDLLGMPVLQVLQNRIARRIARRRTPDISHKYGEIGGGSPQLAITESLTNKVVRNLAQPGHLPEGWAVVHSGPLMRYTKPGAAEAYDAALAAGADEIWLVSQYPHCARATTGSSLRDCALTLNQRAAAGRDGPPPVKVRSLASYGDDPAFHDLWAQRLRRAWQDLNPSSRHLIASAHNLPISYIAGGDPYRDQIDRCARQTLARLGLREGRDWTLAWQSAVGPVRWMDPDTRDVIRSLAARGVREVLVWPLAFVSDHIETLHEVDIEFADMAKSAGLAVFRRVPNFNDDEDFVTFMTQKIAHAAQDISNHTHSLAARALDEWPSGEGCHRQPGGCLCGRYWLAGRAGRKRGVAPMRLQPSHPPAEVHS